MRTPRILLARSIALLVLLFGIEWPAIPQTQAVSIKVFDSITAPAFSAKLPNFGQAMHILAIRFPATAPATTVTGIRVRLEASYDDVVYFPIQDDVTTVSRLGGQLYTIATAYAPWPYLRVRSITTAPYAMTIYYTGQMQPIGPVLPSTAIDRMIL